MAMLTEDVESRVERGLDALRREFPSDAEHVSVIGHAHFSRLRAGARIEDFLPVLVYRLTRDEIRTGRELSDRLPHRDRRSVPA